MKRKGKMTFAEYDLGQIQIETKPMTKYQPLENI